MENRMDPTKHPATGHDIMVALIWITTLGKALVKTGTLKKTDLTGQLHQLKPSCTPELQLEIENMLMVIDKW
jgi:hypothetical protein